MYKEFEKVKDNLGHADKNILINMLQEQNLLQKEKIKRLEKRLKDLEAKLNKNSSNSNKPPSSDFKKSKPKKTTSSRKRTGKKPGGQPGHRGNTLEMVKNPDEIIRLTVEECKNCGNNLKNVRSKLNSRQVFEIPKPKIIVTEWQTESKYCKCCEYITSACFPAEITNKTQYGLRAKSLMAYINQNHYIPFARSSEFFKTIYGIKISPATIVNAVKTLSNKLSTLDEAIKEFLTKAKIINCDETSMSVNGIKHWLHAVSTKQVAHYALHSKRGSLATKDIGILPKFKGIMVHDHWRSYYLYKENKHGLCNAHHIRELRYINENHNMKWAAKMSDLLVRINKHKDKYVEKSRNKFSLWLLKKYNSEYESILAKACKEQAIRATLDSHNLIKRFTNYKQDVLRFMYNFAVPFTNNLSEQDLRMAKVKQKISGCFRNSSSGDDFCKIRNLIITARKNCKNVFKMIQQAFRKNVILEHLLAT